MSTQRVKEIGDAEFAARLRGDLPVLVDFYATWCGPCKAMSPVVERLAARLAGRAEVVKINVDEHPELAVAQSVRSVPTFLGLAGGREVGRVTGMANEQSLAAIIEPYLSSEQDTSRPSAAA